MFAMWFYVPYILTSLGCSNCFWIYLFYSFLRSMLLSASTLFSIYFLSSKNFHLCAHIVLHEIVSITSCSLLNAWLFLCAFFSLKKILFAIFETRHTYFDCRNTPTQTHTLTQILFRWTMKMFIFIRAHDILLCSWISSILEESLSWILCCSIHHNWLPLQLKE